MKTCGIIAASLFGALVAAAPVNKRDIVWVTETAVDVVTVAVTATVWVGADETAATSTAVPTFSSNFAHQPKTWQTSTTASSVKAPVASASVSVAPTPSSVSSVSAEPTISSTSVYVAPTTPATSKSTSVYVAPTTSAYVAPTTTEAPTSTYVAPSSATSAPAASSSAPASNSKATSSSSSGLAAPGTSYTGDLTYYDTGMGACGLDSTSTDHIVAISQQIFDAPEYATANPNLNPLCGRKISITGADGSQYTATVVDRCVGCDKSSIDASRGLFDLVAPSGDGRVSGTKWSWL